MTDTTKLPKPPTDAVAKYNDILRQHTEAKNAVLEAKRAGIRNREAEEQMAALVDEFNELRRQYDFSPPRDPLLAVIDALVSETEGKR